ncbi:MAG: hydantoinase B/oxoprolinase family protein [Proteobacteria bacterium]|nr:hydantoinase B/oxoprolinase family protein [Pseudomonadota bacterium]
MNKQAQSPANAAYLATELDPITAEVVRCALDNIADEMAVVLLRTSGSPVLTEAKDFSAVVFDAVGRQVGSAGYVLGHLASSRIAIQKIIEKRMPDDLHPGDIFICNDPYTVGALHQGDVGVVMPIHQDNTLIGWTFTNAHLIDVGGVSISGIAPQAHDCFEEAIRFPGSRAGQNGVLNQEWIGFIEANVRVPISFINDVRSLIAACHAGAIRMRALVEEYGVATLDQYINYNIGLSEKAFRERIAQLPDGVAHTYDWVEYDGRGTADLYGLSCEMAIEGDQLRFTFAGVDQIDAFINATPSAVAGIGVITPIICQLAFDIPFNEGIWNCIEIDTGHEGTIVNPKVPAPVTNAHMETGARVGRMVNEALSIACSVSDSPMLRGRAAGQTTNSGAGAAWFGVKADGSLAIIFPLDNLVGIGGGAQTTGDGQDLYGFQTTLSVSFPDVEVHELVDPFFVLWRRYSLNSGGAGFHRGGLALDQAYMLWKADNFSGSGFLAAVELPPRGFAGGYPGGLSRSAVIRNSDVLARLKAGQSVSSPDKLTGNLDVLNAKVSNVPLREGDVYWASSSGSGGLGDPFHRAPAQVEQDLNDAKISRSSAEILYGAVVSEANGVFAINNDATWNNREQLRAALVPSKRRSLRDAAQVKQTSSVSIVHGHWNCAHCAADLGTTAQSWKTVIAPHRRALGELFDQVQTRVRTRHEQAVLLSERFCPQCASCLSVDVELDGVESTPPGFNFRAA